MFIKAFNYKAWADDRTLRAIESINKDSFSDCYAFALQQINHMMIVEERPHESLGDIPPTVYRQQLENSSLELSH